MPPVAIAAAALATGVGGAIIKGVAAGERSAEARRQQGLAIDAAKISPRELKEFDAQIRDSEKSLARERKLIDAVDPTLIEASNQAFQLLKGKEAAILGPLKRQRERQRTVLRNRLRQQLGSAFEQSSAGIQALTKFDTSTSDLLANAQQSTTMQLLGVTASTARTARQGEQAALSARSRAVGILQTAKAREVSAITETSQAVAKSAGGVTDAIAGGLGAASSFLSFGAQNVAEGSGLFGISGGGGGGSGGNQAGGDDFSLFANRA